MRLQLIVTGDLERVALGDSLSRFFGATGNRIDILGVFQLHGVTTNRLRDPAQAPDPANIPSAMRRLARRLIVDTVQSKSKGQALPDLVLGVDDIELGNVTHPEYITGWLRRALAVELADLYPSAKASDRIRAELRQRCSFHLLCPLVETYFFPEPQALGRAGVASGVPVYMLGADVEQFETDDPDFLPLAQLENEKKRTIERKDWWHEQRHPKRYLEWLVERSGGLYDEALGGVAALRELDWPKAASTPTAIPFLRALMADISDALGTPNPLGQGTPSPVTYPSRSVRDVERTLRNL